MKPARLAAAALAIVLLVSCGSLFATHIRKILDDPKAYDGKTVTVSGKVEEATNLLFVKYYVVDDGTGRITVVTDRPLPKTGTRVCAKGVVHDAFSLGSLKVVVIKE